MGRARVKGIFAIAVSPAMAAALTSLPLSVIRSAIYKTGDLEARIVRNRVRVPTESIITWLRTFPRATLSRIKKGKRT
jgi:hypothetical protein